MLTLKEVAVVTPSFSDPMNQRGAMNRKEPVRPAVACLLFALVILYAATGHAARSWNSDIEMTLVDDDGEGSTLTNVVLRGDSPRFVAHAYQFPPWAWRIIPPANGCGRGIATPADWRPGDDVIISPAGSCNAAKDRMAGKEEGLECKDWFFCTKKIFTLHSY